MVKKRHIAKKRQSVVTTHQASIFESWARVTGLHGALDFHHANTPILKIFWALVISCGCFLAINQSIMLINDFAYNSRWLTTVSYMPEKSGMIPWPNFTLCNLNWLFNPTIRDKLKLTHPAVAYDLGFDAGLEFYEKYQANETDRVGLDEYLRVKADFMEYMNKHSNLSLAELRNSRLAQNCEESIMRCGFSSKFNLEADNVSCCDHTNPSAILGCFQVNPQSAIPSEKAGYENGVYFILDPKALSDYPMLTMGEKPSAGVSLEFYFGDNEGDTMNPHVQVGPSTHAVISLTAEKRVVDVRRLLTVQYYVVSEPCVREPSYKFLDYDSYSVKHCRDDCMARYFVESMGCTGQTLRLRDMAYRCAGQKIIEYDSFYKNITKRSNIFDIPLSPQKFNMTQCYADCPDACESTSVSTTVSRAGFPAPNKAGSFQTYLTRAANGSDFQNLTLVEIYFESTQYRVVTKMTRTTVDELISDIGGSLGVWTGISIVTIFQAVVYIAYAFQRYCRPKKCHDKVGGQNRSNSDASTVAQFRQNHGYPLERGSTGSSGDWKERTRPKPINAKDGTVVTEL